MCVLFCQNAFTYFPYFLSGAVSITLLENLHSALWASNISIPAACPLWVKNMTPDALAVVIGILFSSLGTLANTDVSDVLAWTVIPVLMMVFIMMVVLQSGDERNNLSRKFLESPPIRLLGYVSYACYLFQRSLLEWWAPYLESVHNGGPRNVGNHASSENVVATISSNYVAGLPLLLSFFLVLCVIFISWVTHRFYQDKFVVSAYKKVLDYFSK